MSEFENAENETYLQMAFTLDEMNIILKALSKEPFKDVYQLIGKINDEASIQLNSKEKATETNQ